MFSGNIQHKKGSQDGDSNKQDDCFANLLHLPKPTPYGLLLNVQQPIWNMCLENHSTIMFSGNIQHKKGSQDADSNKQDDCCANLLHFPKPTPYGLLLNVQQPVLNLCSENI
jgi:hypothetical protein